MKFIHLILKVILILIWSFIVFYISKALGFSFEPDEISGDRNMMRIVLGVLILVGAYIIWMIDFFPKKKK
jgi:membrane protein DedA with SNARE-associated domain